VGCGDDFTRTQDGGIVALIARWGCEVVDEMLGEFLG